jgi:hypothetical protein
MAIILGIDIGKRSVRGATLRTSLRGFEVDRYLEVPIATLQQDTPRASLIAAALRDLLAQLGDAPDSVMACVDGLRGSLRVVQLPAAARKRVAEVLPFELESLLPFPLDEAVIDYQEQGVVDGDIRLLAAAVPEESVGETLALFEGGGVRVRELSLGAVALEGLLPLLPPANDDAFMLLHLDAEQADAMVVNGGRVELCRTFDEGAETLRTGQRAVQTALHQTLLKYRAEGGPLVKRLVVMGELSDPAWLSLLASGLGMSVETVALPLAKAGHETSPVFGKALALAGRSLRRGKRIDLRKGKFAPPRGVSQLRNYALLISLCSLALAVSYTFSIWAKYRVLAEERDALSAQLEQVTEQRFGDKTNSVTRARELLEGGGKAKDPLPRFDAYRVLGAISAAVSSTIHHDTRKLEITFDEGGQTGKFELQGQIPDLAARDTVADALEAHECIEQLERGKTSTVPGQERKSYALEGVIACPGSSTKKKTKGPSAAQEK